MERHLSVGVTTIVALMAAHRVTAERIGGTYNQAEVDRIQADLLTPSADQTAPGPFLASDLSGNTF